MRIFQYAYYLEVTQADINSAVRYQKTSATTRD